MKIIGKTEGGGFIVTASEAELVNIAGFTYQSSMRTEDRPSVGKEIKVSRLWEALSASRDRKDDIAKLANQLRAAAGRVDTINQALAAPIVEVEVKS